MFTFDCQNNVFVMLVKSYFFTFFNKLKFLQNTFNTSVQIDFFVFFFKCCFLGGNNFV